MSVDRLKLGGAHRQLDEFGIHAIEVNQPIAFIRLEAEWHEHEAERFHGA